MIFDRIRRTGELLTYIRTLKMYGWELLFSSWLIKTRSSEVSYLSVRHRFASAILCFIGKNNLLLISDSLFIRQGSIWMHGACFFGQQHQHFSLFARLDFMHLWEINLMLQRYS